MSERLKRLPWEEWAMIAGVVLVVIALVLPGVWAWHRVRRMAMARADIRALMEACENFYGEYGIWPTPHNGEYGDVRYGRHFPNALVLNILLARDAQGNLGHSVNTRRIAFLDVAPYQQGWSGMDSSGEFIDPWGTPYQIVLDTDLDNICQIEYSVYGRREDAGVVVWSCSRDRMSDTPDDLLSWEL